MDNLNKLGFDEYIKAVEVPNDFYTLTPARVMAEHRGLYILSRGDLEFSAKVTGSMMFSATAREDFPAVGDWVLLELRDENHGIIKEIMPRKTILKRKIAGKESEAQIIAANIDTAFIMQAVDRDYNLKRIERYMALATAGGINTAIIINKTDLVDETRLLVMMKELGDRFPKTTIYKTSRVTGSGVGGLKKDIKKGLTYCFMGSSGVGKSSIINMLLGKESMKTGEISEAGERGRHVTTHRHLFVLDNGGLLIDTPGMREMAVLDSEEGIDEVFSVIEDMAHGCRFSDCTHEHEPGCAVLEALKAGKINEEMYVNYLKLQKENRHNTMSSLERKKNERVFGKFKKEYNKQNKKGTAY